MEGIRVQEVHTHGPVQSSWARFVAVLLTLAASLLVAACGGSTTSTGGDNSGGDNGGDSGSKGGKIKVGLVTDQGGLNDRSFNTLANKGLQQAKKELGVDGNVLESKSSGDYQPNLGQFVSQQFDLIVAVGFLMGDPVKAVAANGGSSKFAIVDYSFDPPLDNVRGLLFKEEEAGYLAGALAGMVESEGKLKGLNGAKVVSAIGGQKIPPVDKYIAGYKAGVIAECKDCKVLISYSQDFIAQDKCKEQALTQISQGSDIVFQVAGGCGLGALDAVKTKGVWGIGVDADQAYLGSHILTSALKKVDVAVFDTIKAAQDGSFQGGSDGVYGLNEDGVGLGKIAPAATAYEARVAKVVEEIKAGKITIPTEIK